MSDEEKPPKEEADKAPSKRQQQTWKLPDHFEDHVESALIKCAAGAAAGGACALLFFRGGSKWRTACVAAGLGVALGSQYARVATGTAAATTSAEERVPPS
jgi:hypothetical protein